MRVLVTRPLEDARETEAHLGARGHKAVVAPLLRTDFHSGPDVDLKGVQAIVATSANGVRALARRTGRRDIPVFAVGPQTTHVAQAEGFTNVKNADGDVAALAKALPLWASAEKGPLLHASGTNGAGELAKMLSTAGFQVRTEFLYDVSAVTRLPRALRGNLAQGRLDAVLLFSPRSSRIFAESVARAGLVDAASHLIGVCISQAAASALASLNMPDIRIAKRPNENALLDCLG